MTLCNRVTAANLRLSRRWGTSASGAQPKTRCSSSSGPTCSTLGYACGSTPWKRAITDARIDGVIEMTPGIRSLLIRFDWRRSSAMNIVTRLRPLLNDVREVPHVAGGVPDRSPAALLGRPGLPRSGGPLCSGRTGRCPLVPGQHRVHPSDQRAAGLRGREGRRALGRIPGDGTRRCLSRCAGGDTRGSPSSTRHHQVQPRAYLDRRELGGHRRCLPVHLRYGRARRLPIRWPHFADVEPPSPGPELQRALAA